MKLRFTGMTYVVAEENFGVTNASKERVAAWINVDTTAKSPRIESQNYFRIDFDLNPRLLKAVSKESTHKVVS
jgi:hypothetical protein